MSTGSTRAPGAAELQDQALTTLSVLIELALGLGVTRGEILTLTHNAIAQAQALSKEES